MLVVNRIDTKNVHIIDKLKYDKITLRVLKYIIIILQVDNTISLTVEWSKPTNNHFQIQVSKKVQKSYSVKWVNVNTAARHQ